MYLPYTLYMTHSHTPNSLPCFPAFNQFVSKLRR